MNTVSRRLKPLVRWAAMITLVVLVALAGAADARGDAPASEERLDERGAVVEWINEAREGAGLPPLTADRRLFDVAQGRARELAASHSVETDERALQKVSRALLAGGYQAHRWTERAILGYDDPVAMVRNWSSGGEVSFANTSLGPYEDVGIGIAPAADGALAISLLFAVPRSTELTRISEPLRDLRAVRATVLARTNRARAEKSAKLTPLREDATLDRAAQAYAERMLKEGFYGHVAPDGSDPADRARVAGYGEYYFLAENLAQGLFEPAEVVERWLGSRHHRDNILHPGAEEMGLGLAFGDTDDGFRVLWVQMFGRR